MSKVITFSRTFPAYHPKAGQPTYFVEKLWNSIETNSFAVDYAMICRNNEGVSPDILWPFWRSIKKAYSNDGAAKHHTIRGGNRFKVGDKFSPRVWSGKPYRSKQIVIAPDIEVVKVWGFEISKEHYHINGFALNLEALKVVAANDGLEVDDLENWFAKQTGKFQIICWSNTINY